MAEIKKEIEIEIAHVLLIDIVGCSKLSINQQRAVADELSEVVRSSDQLQKAEAAELVASPMPTTYNGRIRRCLPLYFVALKQLRPE
jgi:hypothetical protein